MSANAMLIIIVVLAVLLLCTLILMILSFSKSQNNAARMESYLKSYTEIMANNQRILGEQQDIRLRALEESMGRLRNDNSLQFEGMMRSMDDQIEGMRQTVDSRLDEVYKGLGEMKSVAANVGDLKKILSNVKTRGILGEVQLAAILEQILNSEQYETNVATRKGSSERVEFAIRLPGDGDSYVYLPVDSKFPGDAYGALMDAYETGDKVTVDVCKKRLFQTMAGEAKDIRDKYIDPPNTTDFAIMFLPFEGLYAEAVNGGMVEMLQRKYKVTIAGPTTMAALLNSLQMGFNTLAVEKKSSEVWELLGAVRTEFDTFADVLAQAQNRINQANAELDKLVGVRTRKIQSKLRNVAALGESDTRKLLDD
ncbi:MAG: DNA recombination protein RmuC [Firmicutes bacterium]|nr:DNA recombination protein RmuC [Bacillota bacterium]